MDDQQGGMTVGAAAATWDPTLYGSFAALRDRPFHDLVARVGAREPAVVVDLGCGDGSLTATLARRWPAARVLGVDSSPEMVAAGRARGDGVERVEADLAGYRPPGGTQVVVSNAALQWVPAHEQVITRLAADLPRGGWLAFQVPGNFGAPSHRLVRELVGTPRWQAVLGGLRLRTDPVLEPPGYLELLEAAELVAEVWETTYLQVLAGDDAVLRWISGTALRPVLTALADPTDRDAFRAELTALLREAYPQRPDGTTLFPFRRLFAVGHRPG